MSKPAPLSASLVTVKGQAAPIQDMPTRSPSVAELSRPETDKPTPAPKPRLRTTTPREANVPLNFKVPESFQRAFKTHAAASGMKLNELLVECFERYQKITAKP